MQRTCRHIQIVTPRKYVLDGLWFGAARPKRAIIFVHGLSNDAFSKHALVAPLASATTAVIYFSNRGHDVVTGIKRLDRLTPKGYRRVWGGVAHEVFTDCVDDVQGAINFVHKQGVRKVYLVGHSTGCQKIVYTLSKMRQQSAIAGAVLLCPVSYYASVKKTTKPKELAQAQRAARALVKQGKPHQLLPYDVWPTPLDAQRFLSLYTPDSKEEIFTYAQPKKLPRTLQKVRVPLLTVLAGSDEYHDRGTPELVTWFKNHITSARSTVFAIPGATHNFTSKEHQVVRAVGNWMSQN